VVTVTLDTGTTVNIADTGPGGQLHDRPELAVSPPVSPSTIPVSVYNSLITAYSSNTWVAYGTTPFSSLLLFPWSGVTDLWTGDQANSMPSAYASYTPAPSACVVNAVSGGQVSVYLPVYPLKLTVSGSPSTLSAKEVAGNAYTMALNSHLWGDREPDEPAARRVPIVRLQRRDHACLLRVGDAGRRVQSRDGPDGHDDPARRRRHAMGRPSRWLGHERLAAGPREAVALGVARCSGVRARLHRPRAHHRPRHLEHRLHDRHFTVHLVQPAATNTQDSVVAVRQETQASRRWSSTCAGRARCSPSMTRPAHRSARLRQSSTQ